MTRKIKLLFILPDINGGGTERVTLNLLRHLDRSLFEPTLLLLIHKGYLWDEIPEGIRCISVLSETAGKYRYNIPRLLSQIISHSRRSDIVIGALEFHAAYYAFLGGTIARKPIVGWIHTNMDYSLLKQPRRHNQATRFCYPRFDRIVFVSRGTATSLQNVTSVRPEKMSIIYNPIDLEEIVAKSQEPLPEWSSSVFVKPVVLAVGRFVKVKNFSLLIRAHAILKTMGLNHHLLIIGEGPQRDDLEKLSRSLGVADSVFMPGFFANPFPFFKAARVLVLSSQSESFGLVIAEAMTLGVPIVATDCPTGPAEILENGRHGILVPPEDPMALAEGIQKLLASPATAMHYVKLGHQRVQDFAPETIVPQWEKLFQELATSRFAAQLR